MLECLVGNIISSYRLGRSIHPSIHHSIYQSTERFICRSMNSLGGPAANTDATSSMRHGPKSLNNNHTGSSRKTAECVRSCVGFVARIRLLPETRPDVSCTCGCKNRQYTPCRALSRLVCFGSTCCQFVTLFSRVPVISVSVCVAAALLPARNPHQPQRSDQPAFTQTSPSP